MAATEKAPGLHEGTGMKRCIVAILAAVTWLGCGVGVDDPEGQAAVKNHPVWRASRQGLAPSDGQTQRPSDPDGAQGGSTTGNLPVNPRVLPQDPVPLLPTPPTPPDSAGPSNPRADG